MQIFLQQEKGRQVHPRAAAVRWETRKPVFAEYAGGSVKGEKGRQLVMCFLETPELGRSRHMTCVYYCKFVHVDGHAHANGAGCCTA